MSRYIDADDAMERIKQAYEDMGVDTHGVWNKQLAEIFKVADVEDVRMCLHKILGAVSQAPSIDIVRCGECKYWIDDRKAEEDMGTCGLTHYFTNADDFCSYGMRNADSNTLNTLDALDDNSSEKPNNCEHITEDGVTCAKYPACDDCPDNPLNKVKGSERLLKGKDEPQTDVYDYKGNGKWERSE